MEPLFDRREYPDGIRYIQTMQPIPGQAYYVRRVDESNQIYYAQQVYQPAPQATLMQAPSVYPATQILIAPTSSEVASVDEALSLHLAITILSIFFPTLVYLIGFPFCFVRLRNIVRNAGNHPHLTSKLNAYGGVGWTTYFFQVIMIITLCVFWIPDCHLSYRYSYSYYYCTMPGLWVLAGVSVLVFIFTVITAVLGASLCSAVRSTVSGAAMVKPAATYGTLAPQGYNRV